MSDPELSFDPLELDVYERSQANILRLKETLPKDLVANLAREVIRRVGAHGTRLAEIAPEPSPEDLEALSLALISSDDKAAATAIANLQAKGEGAEVIYLHHLAAAARMLGDWWSEDRVNFGQVTVASGRMLAIMRSMRNLFEPALVPPGKTAIFAAVPGEDHTLGVRMAADLFRKAGWEITLLVGLDHDALVSEIEQFPSGIVGLSISGEHSIEALSRLVVAVHINAPHVSLLVSGQNIDAVKPVLDLMGLAAVTADIEDAKTQMNDLWEAKLTKIATPTAGS